MSFDAQAYHDLLEQARQRADQAERDQRPEGYREAYQQLLAALTLLEQRDDWREAVLRATEEYQGDEGV